MVSSILIMLPLMMVSEKFGHRKAIFLLSIMMIVAAELLLGIFNFGQLGLGLALILFFGAFNLLEASLPSWVSRVADSKSKGTALGVYSTGQYLGTFIGGVAGGWTYQHYSGQGVFIFCAVWALVWLFASAKMSDSGSRISQ